MRILSGVQPSGRLHIGNYFGAIRQYVKLQEEGHECFYFIANYHALTSVGNAAELEANVLHVAMAYLALGIDPKRSVFFVQSDVPQVTELCWFLNCVCPVSLMEKATSYKDKIARGIGASVGLFDYPVLQAADIVIYDSNLVPVGQDQKQHIEITRDLAAKFNQAYGEALTLPEPYIVPDVAIVPGLDGQKMSKSYDNTIEIFATPKQTEKRCLQIVTDSTPLEAPKNPEQDNVFALLRLVAPPEELAEIEQNRRRGIRLRDRKEASGASSSTRNSPRRGKSTPPWRRIHPASATSCATAAGGHARWLNRRCSASEQQPGFFVPTVRP